MDTAEPYGAVTDGNTRVEILAGDPSSAPHSYSSLHSECRGLTTRNLRPQIEVMPLRGDARLFLKWASQNDMPLHRRVRGYDERSCEHVEIKHVGSFAAQPGPDRRAVTSFELETRPTSWLLDLSPIPQHGSSVNRTRDCETQYQRKLLGHRSR